jgi:hypothetical protein
MAIAARQKSVGTASVMIMGTREVARAEALSAVRVFIAASAEAEVETLSRLLHGSTQLEVIGTLGIAPFDATTLTGKCADVLLLTSCGNFQ